MKRSFIIFLLITGGLAAGFIVTRLFITPFTMNTTSMMPGLSEGSFCIFLKTGRPSYGDIVLAKDPAQKKSCLVKRVAAIEDDFVEIKEGKMYINNKRFTPSWKTIPLKTSVLPAKFSGRDSMLRIRIKRNHFFLLNDSLDKSYDSREFGPVALQNIVGRLIFSKQP